MARRVKCGWCGRLVGANAADEAVPHVNGAALCLGSGRARSAHNFLMRSHAEARGATSLPKSPQSRPPRRK